MSTDRQTSAAEAATDARLLEIVAGAPTSYPSGSELVPSDLPGLPSVIAENVASGVTTVIVHDDGREVIVDPE